MRKWSRKKEKAVVDYGRRWPTQQTLHEPRDELDDEEHSSKPKSRRVKALEAVSIPLQWMNLRIESWQDGIDHRVELIESRKQKRPSPSTSFECSGKARYRTAKTKPGRSTHPYDTGVAKSTAGDVRKSIPQQPPSRQVGRVMSPREKVPRMSDRLRSTKRAEPRVNLDRERRLAPEPQKNDGPNITPESQAGEGYRSQTRIKLRDILRLHKSSDRKSNRNPSEYISIPTVQMETEEEAAPIETRTRRRRRLKEWMVQEERDADGSTPGKSGRDGDRRSEKIANDGFLLQPDKVLSKASGPKLKTRRRESISPSQARPSTTGTSSAPGTTIIHRDFAREGSRETPSPFLVLRSVLSSRKTPLTRPATQPALRNPGFGTSTSTLPLGTQSRDSRTLSKQSAKHENRAWVTFWRPSRRHAEDSLRDNADKTPKPGDYAEPAPGGPSRNGPATQERLSDKTSRTRWRWRNE
ncbi:hypothetical protein F5Y05DRAFT_399218 [Hypoxylon sp. FL0543]|nr:hypothetical protein F5Y05DRAFT_399218 [Hypoxylon sp. FL0543]